MRKAIAAGFAAATLLATTATPASAATVIDGFWDSDATGRASTLLDDCGGDDNRAISNGFCWIDDALSVELGVKFKTNRSAKIGGIRVYRVDGDSGMTGTLWEVTEDSQGEQVKGKQLSSGTFAPTSDSGWQDLVFAEPVDLHEGTTYVASYFAPTGKYAFAYDFFTDDAVVEVGPLTATASVVGDNGVFCYSIDPSCAGDVPLQTFWDTNYWVTPLLWEYDFGGYQQPIDPDAINVAKAGRAIPVKFSLGGDQGLDILGEGPKAQQIKCPDETTSTGQIEETATSGFSTLTYDPETDQYTYVWKTNKKWSGCYTFDLGLNDGSDHTFDVQFVK